VDLKSQKPQFVNHGESVGLANGQDIIEIIKYVLVEHRLPSIVFKQSLLNLTFIISLN
jgi:hypothetical protein